MDDVETLAVHPQAAPESIPRVPAGATDTGQQVRRLDDPEILNLALDQLEAVAGRDGHHRDFVAAACQRLGKALAAEIGPTLEGRMVNDDQNFHARP